MRDESKETDEMMTLVRALSARQNLWEVITAVLPIVIQSDAHVEPDYIRERYQGVFEAMGMSSESDRDIALLSGAVEAAQWVIMASEVAGVDPEAFWQRYLARQAGAC